MKNATIEAINYGPLARLIGVWKGDHGEDIAPDPGGSEKNPFYETITFEAAAHVTNAEEQTLSIVRYHQVVSRKSDDQVFHDQIGYWLWDSTTNEIIQTLTIPRGVTLLAGGVATENEDGAIAFQVMSEDGHPEWGIQQSPFLKRKARTKRFSHTLKLQGDQLQYRETTLIDIYGQSNFEHVDQNTLRRE